MDRTELSESECQRALNSIERPYRVELNKNHLRRKFIDALIILDQLCLATVNLCPKENCGCDACNSFIKLSQAKELVEVAADDFDRHLEESNG